MTPWFDGTIEWQETLLGFLSDFDDLPADLNEAHGDYIVAVSELLELHRRIRDHLADGESDFSSPDLAEDPELGLARQGAVWDGEARACGMLKFVSRKAVPGLTLECNFRCTNC